MANTLLLDTVAWDLVLDSSGNIALASDPYSVGQDVASALRTTLGEVWFDTSQGVPYFQSILGHVPPISYIKAKLIAAALTVPGVTNPACYIGSMQNGKVSGQLTFSDASGAAQQVGF